MRHISSLLVSGCLMPCVSESATFRAPNGGWFQVRNNTIRGALTGIGWDAGKDGTEKIQITEIFGLK